MRKRILLLPLALLLFAPGLRPGEAQQNTLPLRYLFSGTDALILNRPEFVSGGDIAAMRWSPDGTYALVLRDAAPLSLPGQPEPSASPFSITAWYDGSHRIRTLWSEKLSGGTLLEANQAPSGDKIFWFPKTDTALACLAGKQANGADVSHCLLIEPAHERVRDILTDTVALHYNSVLPVILMIGIVKEEQDKSTHNAYRLLHADGTLQNLPDFPGKDINIPDQWSDDGRNFYTVTLGKLDANGKRVHLHYALDTVTGQWTQLEAAPKVKPLEPAAEPAKSDLRIVYGASVVEQAGVRKTLHPAWLETGAKGGPRRVLIAADCEGAKISPKGDAVLYQTPEGAFVLPLTRMSGTVFTKVVLRSAVMSRAKQVGLGLMMYVQDYDESFPPADFKISEAVNPYVKNSEVFEGFTYSYPGKTVADITKPAETVIGTVAGPGGEAVIYADGHVKWRDKP